jgi:hypothetical protein
MLAGVANAAEEKWEMTHFPVNREMNGMDCPIDAKKRGEKT